jgi:uncharacterized membrane protein
MGVFYVNPDDPSLFTPKRFGIGYTLNFGNPRSWLVLAVALLPAIALVLWLPSRLIQMHPGVRPR